MTDEYIYVSKCCQMFNIIDNGIFTCSGCKKIWKTIEDDEMIPVDIYYSINVDKNISSEIIKDEKNKMKRFAGDITLELCDNKKCEKCGSQTRYARDGKDEIFFICDNKKCRHIN